MVNHGLDWLMYVKGTYKERNIYFSFSIHSSPSGSKTDLILSNEGVLGRYECRSWYTNFSKRKVSDEETQKCYLKVGKFVRDVQRRKH